MTNTDVVIVVLFGVFVLLMPIYIAFITLHSKLDLLANSVASWSCTHDQEQT